MEQDWKENFRKKVEEINIEIDDRSIDKFYEYMNLLIEWNEKINLTSIIDENDILIKHFIDSLTIFKYLEGSKTIVDIGTGAGFPGIPLSIMRKDCNFTLVDSLNKRINFLNEIKQKIDLKNLITIHTRAEDFGQNKKFREYYDCAVSRAVANLNILVEYLIPTVKIGGKVICMKGNKIEDELKEAEFAITNLGGRVKTIEEFYLPETDMKRNIIIIEKISHTEKQYPRRAGLPSKKPLK